VLTLGIDMSAQDAKTAACVLDWRNGQAIGSAARLSQGLSDEQLLALMDGVDKVGLDAPFGWPDRFREMVNGWSDSGAWEASVPRSAHRGLPGGRARRLGLRR
jgi:predicted nuclease with RNAse H fold